MEALQTEVKPGQLYQLGRHQLWCGDANALRDRPQWRSDLVLTDPPFEMKAEQVRDAIAHLSGNFVVAGCGIEYHRLCTLKPFRYWFEVISQRSKPQSLPGMQGAQILHWGNAFLTKGDVHCFDRTLAPSGYFPSVMPPFKAEIQGNYAKPLQWAIGLLQVCHAQTVCDPFAGTGAVLIACEKLGKTCFAIELQPKLCALTIARWENATDQKAYLQNNEVNHD